MAAPTPASNRSTPLGLELPDGFSTQIVITGPSGATQLSFWEKTVQPPGLDGGAPVEITTMLNTSYRTKRPRNLIDLTEVSGTCAYDARIYAQLLAVINQDAVITVIFPDLSSLCFYGYLQKFEPEALEEGKFATAKYVITPTNYDYTNYVEAAPVYTRPPGTGTY